MIIDNVINAKVYNTKDKRLSIAMEFLYDNRDGYLPKERYDLDEGVYALIKSYETRDKSSCKYEAHCEYIDIHYIVEGDENIGWAPKDRMAVKEYIKEKDKIELTGTGEMYPLHKGDFAIFYPNDAHMPCIAYEEPMKIKKIIVKIPV